MHGRLELFLVGALGVHHVLVFQAAQIASDRLDAVLEIEDSRGRLARVLRAGRGETLQSTSMRFRSSFSSAGSDAIAIDLELRHRVQPLRRSRIAGDKHQIAVARALGVPLQIIRRVDRLSVFIDAEQRHVQVVARIREVVGIAAEKRGLLFRREHDAATSVYFL